MEVCVICKQPLGTSPASSLKGSTTINQTSETRNDTIHSAPGETVHQECRRKYCMQAGRNSQSFQTCQARTWCSCRLYWKACTQVIEGSEASESQTLGQQTTDFPIHARLCVSWTREFIPIGCWVASLRIHRVSSLWSSLSASFGQMSSLNRNYGEAVDGVVIVKINANSYTFDLPLIKDRCALTLWFSCLVFWPTYCLQHSVHCIKYTTHLVWHVMGAPCCIT